jgi:hypothetical protein
MAYKAFAANTTRYAKKKHFTCYSQISFTDLTDFVDVTLT